MRKLGKRGLAAAVLCAAMALASPARADFSDPLFAFAAPEEVPPGAGFEGACGLAVDKNGAFYVADYYHGAVDAFTPARGFLTQLVEPGGPCGLAVDGAGRLYVNEYHRRVHRYVPESFPLGGDTGYDFAGTIDAQYSTGVAVDPADNSLYVSQRTEVGVYGPSGEPVLEGGEPLLIGQGSLADAYGVAVSAYPPTAGFVYVPDAASDTVKVYVPDVDPDDPAMEIFGPPGGFTSLRDAAVAIDRPTGDVYVSDHLHEGIAERPEATIYVFNSSGGYKGHLKYNVIDARPPGLAVDNSEGATQGRVYVTSGNTEGAVVYAYPPGAATMAAPLCAPGGSCPQDGSGGGGGGFGVSTTAPVASAPSSPGAEGRETPAHASEVSQKGTLRVAVSGRFAPKRLPRKGVAPIAVTVGGQITTTDQSPAPQLKSIAIEINRRGRLDYTGLPVCPYDRIQPASSQRALSACRSSLVGEGSFEAEITLASQEPYPTRGKLLVFNGKSKGKPVLFGQIYSPRPFATSFVIVFAISEGRRGTWGTELSAEMPMAMRAWGNLTGIEMQLSRRYRYGGERRSYLSAGCPAPEGFGQAVFPLARASFGFAGGRTLSSTLTRICRVG
jgi:hypothetical protein